MGSVGLENCRYALGLQSRMSSKYFPSPTLLLQADLDLESRLKVSLRLRDDAFR